MKSGRVAHGHNMLSSRQALSSVAFLQYGVRWRKSCWIIANRLDRRKFAEGLWSIPAREIRGGLDLNPTCLRAQL